VIAGEEEEKLTSVLRTAMMGREGSDGGGGGVDEVEEEETAEERAETIESRSL
jgi:hypothetical protein